MKFINGNGQQYEKGLPLLVILDKFNDTALQHLQDNTGLVFKPFWGGVAAQPKTAEQIVKLLMTYNFKTRYYDNHDIKNAIFLRGDHHVGFDVRSICLDCCKENNIHARGLDEGARLAC